MSFINSEFTKILVPVKEGNIATYSKGDGPTLIFLHGGPGDTHHYTARMAKPFFNNYRCVFFDQRGTGASNNFPRKPESYSIEALLSDLLAIKQQLNASRTMLVGHSWGAIYALYSCIANPNEWDRAALINMGPLDQMMSREASENLLQALTPEEKKEWGNFRAKRNAARAIGDADTVQTFDRKMMFLRVKSWIWHPGLRQPFLEEYFKDPATDREVNSWIWSNSEKWFSWQILQTVTTKLWLCSGIADAVPRAQLEKIHKAVQTSKLTVLDGCGHIPWVDQPELFYSNLSAFLKET